MRSRCPLSNVLIAVRRGNVDAVLDGNHQVRSMIDSQPVTCKYVSHGCTVRPMLDSIGAHEANCPCRPAKCARCPFVGSRAATTAHEQVCPYVVLSPVLDAQDARIRGLEGEVRRLTESHFRNRNRADLLRARLEALEAARPGELAVVSPARRASEDDVRETCALCDEGWRHGQVKKWPEAIAALRRCVELDPNNCDAWYQLECTYYEQNGNKSCEASFEPYTRCILLDPTNTRAYINLGALLMDVRKDIDGAENMYRKAIELDPTQMIAHNNLGLVLDQQKKWPEAIEAYRRCVELDPNDSEAWLDLGRTYREQNGGNSCEAAFEPYTRCIALDATNAEAHMNLGQILQNVRKDYDGAERIYRKAIELDPTYAHPYWDLSLIFEDQKDDIPGAVKLMEECVRLGGIPGSDGKRRLAMLRRELQRSFNMARGITGLADVLRCNDAMAPAAAWCRRRGVTTVEDLKDLGDDGVIEEFMTAAGLTGDLIRRLVKKKILEFEPAAAAPTPPAAPPFEQAP